MVIPKVNGEYGTLYNKLLKAQSGVRPLFHIQVKEGIMVCDELIISRDDFYLTANNLNCNEFFCSINKIRRSNADY